MRHKRPVSAHGFGFKRNRFFGKALLAAIILIIVSLFPVVFFKLKGQSSNERREIRDFFESGDFENSYNLSRDMLKGKPLDLLLLNIHGFSAYQLAIAQINNFDTLSYINDCIWSLRKALLLSENSTDSRIFYVLGKAYFYKGKGYADLAIKYLEKARADSYRAPDIPEYLGLAYAAIGDYRSSVAAFSDALTAENTQNSKASDVLLLSIAKSYLALEEYDSAKAYLIHSLETSRDSKTIAAARILLGGILAKSGDLSGAEAEYLKVLEENDDTAELHYQLGELYVLGGDTTRARAEWRRAVRIDPAYEPARNRLNMQ